MSVAYRLAPEYPFPAAVDDALNAVRAGAARARELRVEIDRLYVAGDSAGAMLALVAALAFKGMARKSPASSRPIQRPISL
jgi:acetyl esterase